MYLRPLSTFVVAFVATATIWGIVGRPAPAKAFGRLVPALLCQKLGPMGSGAWGYRYPGSEIGSDYDEGVTDWECPFVDERSVTDGLQHSEIARINIHGVNNLGTRTHYASACIKEFASTGESCGYSRALGSGGVYTTTLTGFDLYIWSHPNNVSDFAYVLVDASYENRIWGFFANDS